MCALALSLVGTLVFLAVALGDPLELLEQPTPSAQRFVDRRVLIDTALANADESTRRWIRLADPRAARPDPAAAASLLEEVRRFDGPSPDLLGCTAVLRASSGDLDAAQELVERLRLNAPRLAAAIAAAWLDGPPAPTDEDPWHGAAGPTCRNLLATAAAERAGDSAEVARLVQERNDAGASLLDRATSIVWVRFGLVAFGLGVFFVWLLAGRRGTRVTVALVEDAWPPALGTAVLVRGAFWAVLLTILVFALARSIDEPILGLTMPALAAALPLFVLTYQRLLHPQRCGFLRAFGLLPRPTGLARAVLWTFPVFAFDQLGRLAIEHVGHATGLMRHWSEIFAEDFVWAPQTIVLAAVVNYALWVPLSEEIAFRGVLYATLRNRVRPLTATLVSAASFAAFHLAMTAFAPFLLCTATGLATVFWSGLVWTIAYERTRSLIPGLLAHALANLLAVAGFVSLFG